MKHYTIDSKTYDKLPDPLHLEGVSYSPMTDEKFVQLGGTIADDGRMSPKEAVVASFNSLIHELAEQVHGIGVSDFKQAAESMYSGDLIAYARNMGVEERVIAEARARIVEIMADALRAGVSWAELIGGIAP